MLIPTQVSCGIVQGTFKQLTIRFSQSAYENLRTDKVLHTMP